jgi:hypothetical protein
MMATIKDDKEFEERLAQLCRLYRAAREIWAETNTGDDQEVAKWVVAGGKVLDKLSDVLGEIEDHTGCGELRVIVADLKARRAEREQAGTRA